MIITIKNKNVSLEFGFAFLKHFGEVYNFDNYQDTINHLSKELSDLNNITFTQEDVLKNVILSAAIVSKSKNIDVVRNLSIMDFIVDSSETLVKIIEALSNSFPKDVGNLKARKPASKKR